MTLLRRLFYRKSPDHLLEISERIYVFDRCFSTNSLDENTYKKYIGDTISQLQDYHRDASLMVFNIKEGERGSRISDILSHYEMTVMDYPRQYEKCSVLPMEMIYHFLVSSERWLSMKGSKQNVLLMHCEKEGWPIIAFMLAALLLFRKQYNGEQMTLEMIYMKAPKDLLENMSLLDPKPSQIRYLQCLSRKKLGHSGSLINTPLFIECLILKVLPLFDAIGCKLMVRVYGQDPLNKSSTNTKLLFSSSKIMKHIQNCYKVDLVKIDIHRRVRGDVVLECIRLFNNMEDMLFRIMFHTTFVLSSTLFFTRDDVDISWDAKDQFSKDFEAEVHFIDMDTVPSDISMNLESEDENDSEVSSIDEFFDVDEIFLDCASDDETQRHETRVELSSNLAKDIALDLLIQPKAKDFKDIVIDDGNHNVVKSKYDASVVKDIVLDEGTQNQEKSLDVETSERNTRDNDLDGQDVVSFMWDIDAPRRKKRKSMIVEKVLSIDNIKPRCGRLLNEMLDSNAELLENRINNQTLQGDDGNPMSLAFVCSRNPEEEWKKGFNHDCSSRVEIRYVKDDSNDHLVKEVNGMEKSKEEVHVCLPPLPPPLPTLAFQNPIDLSTTNEGMIPPTFSRDKGTSLLSKVQDQHTHAIQPKAHVAPQPPPPQQQKEDNHILLPPLLSNGQGPTCPPSQLSDDQGSPPLPPYLSDGQCPSPPPLPLFGGKFKGPRLPSPLLSNNQCPTPPPPLLFGGHGLIVYPQPLSNGQGSPPPRPPLFGGKGSPCPPPLLCNGQCPPPRSPSLFDGQGLPPSPPLLSLSDGESPSPPSLPLSNGHCPSPPPPPVFGDCLPLSPTPLSIAQGPHPSLSPLSNGQCPTTPPDPPLSNGPCPPPPPPPLIVVQGLPPPPPPIFVGRCPPPPPPPPFVGQGPPPPPLFGGQGPPPPPPPIFGGQGPPPPPPLGGVTPCPLAPSGPPGVSAPPPPPSDLKGGMVKGRLTRSTALTTSARKQSLKPLHWSKVTRVMQGSLWEELQKQAKSQSEPDIDVTEIENLFSAAVKKPGGISGGQKKSTPKSETVHLVDLRRANNTEIMLTKVKMPLPDMMLAVLSLDESVLDGDQVENLIKFCPTKDEMELLKNHPGDKEKLGKCEQFLLELMKVPRVESKLEVFLFKIQFNSQVADFKRCLDLVNSTSDEVRNSSKLKDVMRIILALGNTLNNGTPRGGAFGFKLDSLLKLNETRATNSRMTLMHYLAKVLAKKYPHLLDFHEDFVTLEAATKIQLKALAEEMQTITKGLEKVNKELIASEDDGPVSEIFCKNVKAFIGSSEAQVGSLMDLYSVVGKNADAFAMYFGEDPTRCPFEQVTQTLLNFVKTFRNAHEENLKKAELDRKKAVKEAELAKCNTPNGKESDTPKESESDTPKWEELETPKEIDLGTPKSMTCDTPKGIEEET